jgi:hypothetical protein
MTEAKCPYCLQTVPTISGFEGQPVFARHEDNGNVCFGWGKSVVKSQELYEAVKEMLLAMAKQHPELASQRRRSHEHTTNYRKSPSRVENR